MVSIYKVSSLQTAWIVYAACSSIVVIRTVFFMPISVIPSPIPDNYNMDVTVDSCPHSCEKLETAARVSAKSIESNSRVILEPNRKVVVLTQTARRTFSCNAENLGCGAGGFWTTSNAFHPLFLSSLLFTMIK